MPASLIEDIRAFANKRGIPLNTQNLNRISAEFARNPSLRPSYDNDPTNDPVPDDINTAISRTIDRGEGSPEQSSSNQREAPKASGEQGENQTPAKNDTPTPSSSQPRNPPSMGVTREGSGGERVSGSPSGPSWMDQMMDKILNPDVSGLPRDLNADVQALGELLNSTGQPSMPQPSLDELNTGPNNPTVSPSIMPEMSDVVRATGREFGNLNEILDKGFENARTIGGLAGQAGQVGLETLAEIIGGSPSTGSVSEMSELQTGPNNPPVYPSANTNARDMSGGYSGPSSIGDQELGTGPNTRPADSPPPRSNVDPVRDSAELWIERLNAVTDPAERIAAIQELMQTNPRLAQAVREIVEERAYAAGSTIARPPGS